MKVFVAVAVVAICAVQIVSGLRNLETLKAGIIRQKNAVQSTLNRLQRHKRDFSYNLGNKLSNAKINSMQEINSIVNPTIKNIEDDANKSTAEGKDASRCYEAARARLREYSLTGFSDLDNCRSEVLSSVSQTVNNIDSTILAGQQVVSYFDSIFPSCFSTSTAQMESCIIGKIPQGTQMARTFESTTNSVISSSNSAESAALVNAIDCNRGPVNNIRDGATSVRMDANKCIAAL